MNCMKKNILSILFLLASCSFPKQEDVLIHKIDVDFPAVDTIAMDHKQTLILLRLPREIIIKDTTLFVLGFEDNDVNVGLCYSINSGDVLTPIINRGRAANEIATQSYSLKIMSHRDTIQFVDLISREIKSISLDDIITKPMGEREFSKTNVPTTIKSFNYKKIDNSVIIGCNSNGDNDAKYFVLDSSKITMFGEYNKEILVSRVNQEITNNIAAAQYDPIFANWGSKVISADARGITLELINAKTKSVVKDRFYTKFTFGEQVENTFSGDPVDIYTEKVYCTENKIYCIVKQINKIKSKEKRREYVDVFILSFDWNLNPIKKYYVGTSNFYGFKYFMSQDCNKIYCLSTEGEAQTLFEGIIY